MNTLDFYRKTNNSLSILILGIPVPESNHHIFAQKLVEDLKSSKNSMKINYLKIEKEEDIDTQKIISLRPSGLIVSSDYILTNNLFDLVIFIDTPEKILQGRGLKQSLNVEMWNEFKKNYRINKFINDTRIKKYYTITPDFDSPAYETLWNSLMELANKNLS